LPSGYLQVKKKELLTARYEFVGIRLIKLADRTLGVVLTKCLSTKVSTQDHKPVSFLIIRPGGIGDAILLIPAIQALKQRYPHAVFDVLAEKRNAAAFRLCPYVNEVFLYDKPKQLLKALRGNYDVVVDTEQWHRLSAVVARLSRARVSIGYATNERKKLFTYSVPYSHDDYEADSFMQLMAPLGLTEPLEIKFHFLFVPDAAREKAKLLLGSMGDKEFAVIFPGASIPERRWGVDKFRAVAERLSNNDIPVVVVGGEGDISDGEKIIDGKHGLNLAGKCSLDETAAVIERCKVLVSGDSGVLHIGVGLDKATVSLFGPGIAKKWAPRGEKHIAINKNLPCSPCTKFGYTPRCPIKAKCLADISVEEVVRAVLHLNKDCG
jgi:ADP-heptose:LPS heptosyltransferase